MFDQILTTYSNQSSALTGLWNQTLQTGKEESALGKLDQVQIHDPL